VLGDRIIGSLPVTLAAAVCARGGRYLHLSLALPARLRGQALDAAQMRAQGAPASRSTGSSTCDPMRTPGTRP
jgi:putative CRISPR-associated protein (TIGR02620 family)